MLLTVQIYLSVFNYFRYTKLQPCQLGFSVCPPISYHVNFSFCFKLSRRLVSSEENFNDDASSPIFQLFIVPRTNCFYDSGSFSSSPNLQCCTAYDWCGDWSFFIIRLYCEPFRYRTELCIHSYGDFKYIWNDSWNCESYFDRIHRQNFSKLNLFYIFYDFFISEFFLRRKLNGK